MPLTKNVDYVSASQLSMFDECPRKWWAMYVKKIPRPPDSGAIKIGHSVHKILELALLSRINKKKEYYDLELIKKGVQERWPLPPQDQELVPVMIENARHLGWFQNFENSFAEKKIRYKINGVKVGGKIDRLDMLDGSARVIDLKTGKYPTTPIKAKRSWQSRLYSYQYLENGQVEVQYWFVRFKNKRPSALFFPSERTRIEREFNETVGRMNETDGSEYCINRYCKWCPFAEECAEMRRES